MKLKFNFLLLIPILFSSVGCSASKKISFHTDSLTFDTYYDDSYFLLNNWDVHEEIALASHAMALATFNADEDFTLRSSYLRELWNNEHFGNIWMSPTFYERPGTDTIAYGIASKKINLENQNFTLVAIAVRGGNYDGEWASNLTLGLEGDAKGFNEASDKVIDGLTSYLKNYEIEGNIKLWISGYSRAAITSNMTAGKLLKRIAAKNFIYDKVNITTDDVYAYCFEPPMGVVAKLDDVRSDLYHGIHNFINYNDFVPLVAPYEWGFTRYGIDHYYPDRLTDIYFDATEREKIISLYHFTYGAENFSDYTVDNWKFFDVGEKHAKAYNLPRESINPSQGRFSRAFVRELANTGIGTRTMYVNFVQDGLRDIMAAVFGLNEDIEKINLANIIPVIFEYSFIKTLVMELSEDQSSEFAMDVEMLFLQIFGANESNYEVITKLYDRNYLFFVMLANAFMVRKDIMTQLLYRDNAMNVAVGHMPEISYSFLSACDSRFYGEKKCVFNDGTYNILHIKNPRSFSLMEKNLSKEVFSFKDGEMRSDCLSAERFADGSIDIYLPKNGAYEYIGSFDSMTLGSLDPLRGETVTLKGMPEKGEF